MNHADCVDHLVPIAFRYFMAADLMRQLCDSYLPQSPPVTDEHDSMLFLVSKAGLCMRYWYGGLYVVVEAWEALGLSDTEIDALLQSPNKALLRRHRNSSFHFQREWLHEKESDFYGSPGAVAWVRQLTAAFGRRLTAELNRVTTQ